MPSSRSLIAIGLGLAASAALALLLHRRRHNRSSSSFLRFSGHVLLVKAPSSWPEQDAFVDLLSQQSVCGIDVEWRPETASRPRSKVALLQLATQTQCLLIQLDPDRESGGLAPSLLEALGSTRILKVGVGALEDAKKLEGDHGIRVSGCVDLRYLSVIKGVASPTGMKNGLSALSERFVGFPLEKKALVQRSDWAAPTLTEEQREYAATDAWAGVAIFDAIRRVDAGTAAGESVSEWAAAAVDVPYSQKSAPSSSPSLSLAQKLKKCEDSTAKFAAKNSEIYNNCAIFSPEGELMCYISKKRLQWYLERNLAELLPSSSSSSPAPLAARLLFKPKGPGHRGKEKDFGLATKENRCVICGDEKNLLTYHIVPHEYRRFFPLDCKSHNSHDCVLLCTRCIVRANISSDSLRRNLSVECDAPLSGIGRDNDARKVQVKRDAGALLSKSRNKIPEARLKVLRKSVSDYFGVEEPDLLEEQIREAAEMNTIISTDAEYSAHGQLVVAAQKDIFLFAKRWRVHFLEHMHPEFLPQFWDVDFPVVREGIVDRD